MSNSPTLHDPAAFAIDTAKSLYRDHEELFVGEAPAAWAGYKQAIDAFAAYLGGEPPYTVAGPDGVERPHPFHTVDEAVVALSAEAYRAGLRAGAALEHLRHTLTANGRVCPECRGRGWGKKDDRFPCDACAGSGVLRAKE